MGYWGWRPLVCGVFMSTWITGCTIVASTDAPTGTATPYPPITLISGRLPDPTAPPYAGTRPLSLSPVPPAQIAPLHVSPPTCYAMGERLVCLGRVNNDGAITSGPVVVDLLLEGADNVGETVTLRGAAAIDQTILPAGESAPYSINLISPNRPDLLTRAQVSLRAGAEGIPPLMTTLAVDNLIWHAYDDGMRWQIAGQAINDSADAVRPVRLVSVLLDASDRVLGYRVIALSGTETLLPGAARMITVDVFSVIRPPAEEVRATLHVEGEVTALNPHR